MRDKRKSKSFSEVAQIHDRSSRTSLKAYLLLPLENHTYFILIRVVVTPSTWKYASPVHFPSKVRVDLQA